MTRRMSILGTRFASLALLALASASTAEPTTLTPRGQRNPSASAPPAYARERNKAQWKSETRGRRRF